MTEQAALATMWLGITAVIALYGGVFTRKLWLANVGMLLGAAFASYIVLNIWIVTP